MYIYKCGFHYISKFFVLEVLFHNMLEENKKSNVKASQCCSCSYGVVMALPLVKCEFIVIVFNT